MTEWELQVRLEESWSHGGIPLGTETLLLVGREVMTDWSRNDSRKVWNKPSVDFLALDRRGRLVVIELKNRIDSRAQALRAALQVTAMALALAATVSWERLEQVHRELREGLVGHDLASAWEAAYGEGTPTDGHAFTPVRRVLAATSFRAAEAIADDVGNATPQQLLALAGSPRNERLANRMNEYAADQAALTPIEVLLVEQVSVVT